MKKKVRVDFFRVVLPKDAPPFSNALSQIITDRPKEADRNRRFGDFWYRLQRLDTVGSLSTGGIVRIWMDGLPQVATLEGEFRELGLKDDEGLSDETQFIYDARYGVMVVQRNIQAVRASTVQNYLANITGIDDLAFEVVLREDAWARVKKMKRVRTIDLGFATPTNAAALKLLGSVGGVADAAQYVGAAEISVTMGMGYKKGSMNVSRVVDVARRLLRLHKQGPDEVRRVEIKGSVGFEGEPLEPIDLLDFRMVEEFIVDTPGRYLSEDAVRGGLMGAIERRAEELQAQFAR